MIKGRITREQTVWCWTGLNCVGAAGPAGVGEKPVPALVLRVQPGDEGSQGEGLAGGRGLRLGVPPLCVPHSEGSRSTVIDVYKDGLVTQIRWQLHSRLVSPRIARWTLVHLTKDCAHALCGHKIPELPFLQDCGGEVPVWAPRCRRCRRAAELLEHLDAPSV